MKAFACTAAALAALLSSAQAHAETTLCTEITALPFTITVQGIYCLKQNLNVNLATGNAITVNAGNVIIDFNGWRISNQSLLALTVAYGVYSQDRKNVTLKNGFIRGFYYGIWLDEVVANASSNHLVEGMKVADNGNTGIFVEGDQSVVRDNRVLNTGAGAGTSAYGIALHYVDDAQVLGNIVSGVSETNRNNGVYVFNSNRVRVSGNVVTGIEGGSTLDRGIGVQSVNQAIVANNRLLNNPGTGNDGIADNGSSTDLACLDNEIGGFGATPTATCDDSDGNQQLFN